MKTTILALGFSIVSLFGVASYGEDLDELKGEIYDLDPIVITPLIVNELNVQKLETKTYQEIAATETAVFENEFWDSTNKTMITFFLEDIIGNNYYVVN